MDGSFLALLTELVAQSDSEQSAQVLATVASVALGGLFILARYVFPLLGLFAGDKAPTLLRHTLTTAIALAVAIACWVVPVSAVVSKDLWHILGFAGVTFLASAWAITKVLRLIGAALKAGIAHAAAAIVPEHPRADLMARQSTSGPIISPNGTPGWLTMLFNSGGIIPIIVVIACAIGYGLTVLVLGPSGAMAGLGATTVNDFSQRQFDPRDIPAQLGQTLTCAVFMILAMGVALLAASRYAAQRGIHYEGDPWARLIKPVRYKRKEADAWRELDAAVARYRERQP